MNLKSCLLSSAYFAPVQWFQKLNRYETCWLEQHDHFIKQTYRNRCVIATTNGLQVLTVPIEKYDGLKCEMKDIRISDHGHWRHLHWNALMSAYGESPFFEFLADDIRPFFERRWEFLFDFNLEITHKICDLLEIEPDIRMTAQYGVPGEGVEAPEHDFRDAIRPKHAPEDPDFEPRRYYQVYEQKHGFQPNLSILDLLFNEGNEAVLYL
ncbi:MAG: WbqC family protein [Prevotella sp.]|nr:WbqC family protein [Prevotella sp.]